MEYCNKIFCLEVKGDYACFTRPEMKVERVSYDVITPSAARAIFEAIFWKPAIKWHIRKIEVLKPIKWVSVRRNEVGTTASERSNGIFIEDNRQQRAGLFLQDVAYRLHAELEFIPPPARPKIIRPVMESLLDDNEKNEWQKDENPGKYNSMFERRARKGQCFNQPYLGCREFSCDFRLIDDLQQEPDPIGETRDFGFMLYDLDFEDLENPTPAFFKAHMEKGIITVPAWGSEEVRK
ncbi:MAG: type I-C CRISPR-associated protein Cas5c [Chlorobium sp.]|nr:MAG: type I-C CRISPR-associated protein Cas5 [Chlorobium sp.]